MTSDRQSPAGSVYSVSDWRADLPDGWTSDYDGEVHTFRRDGGSGALLISVYYKDTDVTDEDLRSFADDQPIGERADVTTSSNLVGVAGNFVDRETAWRVWLLRRGTSMFYVTYTSAPDDTWNEVAEVDSVVNSLQLIPRDD